MTDISMHTAKGKAGFTLIELLVVIVIIIILAAILMPVFAKARDRANIVVCISHARQLGIALRGYLNDYDDNFPCITDTEVARAASDDWGEFYGGHATPTNDTQVGYVKTASVFAQLEPYVKSWGVNICPSDGKTVTEPTAGSTYTSFHYRHFISMTRAPWYVDNFTEPNPPIYDPNDRYYYALHQKQPYKTKWFIDLSKTYILHENADFHTRGNFTVRTTGGALNLIFGDGHAKRMRFNLFMDWAGSYYDYHWPRMNDLNGNDPYWYGWKCPGYVDIK